MRIPLHASLLSLLLGALAVAGPVAGPTATAATAPTATAETAKPNPVAPARAVPDLAVPRGSGPHAVGEHTLSLVDRHRPDPWVPSAGARRLMVSMFYPTPRTTGPTAAYATAAESKAYLGFQREQGAPIPVNVPQDVLSRVRTGALRDAPVLRRPGGHPLVVLSPGFTLQRSSLTALATELASKGYVVAAVDHLYESSGTELPDGRLVPCAACGVEDYSQVARSRVLDVSFVLDQLLGKRPAWNGARAIDRERVAMVGHSIGGNAAAATMASDRRVDAGINLDGTFFEPARRLDRPFMMLGTESSHAPTGTDESWSRDWAQLTGPRVWRTVSGAAHFSFTDYPDLIQQLGLQAPGATLDGDRAVQVTRAYVGAFVDRSLRGKPSPLLNGPSPAFSEVQAH